MKKLLFSLLFLGLAPLYVSMPARGMSSESSVQQDLINAAQSGDEQGVLTALANGANVNIGDPKYRATALMYAIRDGHMRIAQHLLEHGANINQKDINGQTALMYVAGQGDTLTVQYLIEQGARLDEQDKEGYTALILAALTDKPSVVALLLEYGADTTIRNYDGDTALDIAQREPHQQIIALFETLDK